MTNPTIPQIGLRTHQGKRGDENDDHAAWFTVARPDRGCTVYVAAVADGVTSTTGGAQASRIAVEALEAALREPPDPQETLVEWLASAIHHANEEILFEAKRHPEWQGMSTTLVVAALAGTRLYVLHLGDSRAYLIDNQQFQQLTTDHTWAQAAVNAGALSVAEAARHPGRHQLQRYLGAQHQINIARGLLDPATGQIEEYLQIQPGQRILLCTDGIHHRLPATTICQILNEHRALPQGGVEALVSAAIASGEIDDITALLFTVPVQSAHPSRPALFPNDTEATVVRSATSTYAIPQPTRSVSPALWLASGAFVLALLTLYLLYR